MQPPAQPVFRSASSPAANPAARLAAPMRPGLDTLLTALVYFCTARLALLLALPGTNASPLWPPAGIALLLVMLLGPRALLGIWVGAVGANAVAFLPSETSQPWWLLALLTGFSNTCACALGYHVAGKPDLRRGWTIAVISHLRLLGAMLAAAALAGAGGASLLHWGAGLPAEWWPLVWRTWALGDLLGMMLVVGPAILWLGGPSLSRIDLRLLIVAAGCVLLGLIVPSLADFSWWGLILLFLASHFLASPSASWTLFAVALLTLTVYGITKRGPLAEHQAQQVLTIVQAFIPFLAAAQLLSLRGKRKTLHLEANSLIGLICRRAPLPRGSVLLTAIFSGICLMATFNTWLHLLQDRREQANEECRALAAGIRDHLVERLQIVQDEMRRMAKRWIFANGLSEPAWRNDAQELIADSACLQALGWADDQTVVRWIEPELGNQAALGLQLNQEALRRAALEQARHAQQPVFTDMIALKQGGAGFIQYTPLPLSDRFDGYLSAVYRLNDVIRSTVSTSTLWDEERFALQVYQGNTTYWQSQNTIPHRAAWAEEACLALPQPLMLRITLTQPIASSQLPELVLNTGLLLSTLLALATSLAGLAAEQSRQARLAAQTQARFLATMSHEIRTPMNGILGSLHLALPDAAPEQKESLQLAQQSAQGLLSLLNDLLDYSKMEAGGMALEQRSCNVRMIAEECVLLLSTQASNQDSEVAIRFSEDFPNALQGDPLRLRQIVLNLLSNAIKFTKHGCVLLQLTYNYEEQRLTILCQDSGVGMSPAVQARLFQPFVQADASITRNYGGTGLGLSIVWHLVQLMQGTIRCHSEPGSGTTFTVCLPLLPSKHYSSLLRTAIHPVLPSASAPSALSILIVDDNLVNRTVLRRLLQKDGHQVQEAEHGAQAVSISEQQTFSLILMDMAMPVMDGLEATRQLRSRGLQTPIIALTANAFAEDQAACLAAGMNDFLSKPIKPEVLQATLAKHCAPADTSGTPPQS